MVGKLLCALIVGVVAAVAVAHGVRADSSPRPAPTAGETALLRERADAAVAIERDRRSTAIWAVAAAVAAIALVTLGLYAVSARWVPRAWAAWLQWLAFAAIPVAVAVGWCWLAAGGLAGRLDRLPEDSLRRIPDHPVLGADQALSAAAREALTLKHAAADGSLVQTLAMTPALIALGCAVVGLAGLWVFTNRRVVASS